MSHYSVEIYTRVAWDKMYLEKSRSRRYDMKRLSGHLHPVAKQSFQEAEGSRDHTKETYPSGKEISMISKYRRFIAKEKHG